MSNSWYCEMLIRNRLQIRNNILSIQNTYNDSIISANLDDEDFNNLLLVEKTLKELLQNKQLSAKEIIIINKILEYHSLSQIENETGLTRMTIVKILEGVCDRISYILGGEFTDEGFLSKIAKRNNLTTEQVEKAREYMNSNKRYSTLKKIGKGEQAQNE